MEPLVSVLIPCYNAEPWIEETLGCVLGQSWPRVEVVLVDDGSKDNSFAVARRFEAPNVRVIGQENAGAGAARNRALSEAQGDFIQFLDADDLLSRDKIESQVRLLQESPPRMLAVCAARYFFSGEPPDEGILEDGWPLADTDDPHGWLVEMIGHEERPAMVPCHSYLSPRAVVDEVGPWQTFPSPDDDGEYFTRVVLASSGLRRAASGVCYYRRHRGGGSVSSLSSRAHQEGALRNADLMAEHILARADTPRARRALAKSYIERAFSAYPAHAEVTEAALQRAKKLGGTPWRPPFGTWKGQAISRVLGWKAARRLEEFYRRATPSATPGATPSSSGAAPQIRKEEAA